MKGGIKIKRGEQICKITFNAENKLGVKFRLTKEFMVPMYTFGNNPNDEYLFTHDDDVIGAISKYCEREELNWWLDYPECGFGGPLWKDICNIRVLDTRDY